MKEIKEITLEQVDELYQVLQGGELPAGWHLSEQPKLSARAAFSVVWFLQERLRILPDHYARCENCGCLFDTYLQGDVVMPDNEDEWEEENYAEMGVTIAEREKYTGVQLCGENCFVEFWVGIHSKEEAQ